MAETDKKNMDSAIKEIKEFREDEEAKIRAKTDPLNKDRNAAIYYAEQLMIAGKMLKAQSIHTHTRDCCSKSKGFVPFADCNNLVCVAVKQKLEEWQV